MCNEPELKRDLDAEAIYLIYRSYVEHEDELIHHRTTTLVTTQSFLLATLGICYQKRFEVAATFFDQHRSLSSIGLVNIEFSGLMLSLAIIGLASSVIAIFSLRAAKAALQKLEIDWRKIAVRRSITYLPRLTGGGNPKAIKHGIYLSLYTPYFCFIFWLVTLVTLAIFFYLPYLDASDSLISTLLAWCLDP